MTFDATRLDTIRAFGVDDEVGERLRRLGGLQPAKSVDEADAGGPDLLTTGRVCITRRTRL